MSEEMNSGIYEIKNRADGKFYIGSAVNLKARWARHLSGLCNGKHHNSRLQAAFGKYGAEVFGFSVLEYTGRQNLLKREQHYLDTLRPDYNLLPTAGSHLGRKHSEQTKQKISAAKMGHPVSEEARAKMCAAWTPARRQKRSVAMSGKRNHFYGKHPSAETSAKLSAAHTGHPVSAETRAKLSKALTGERNPMYGMSGNQHPMYGKRHSKEARMKMSEAMSGERHPNFGKHHSEETRKKMSQARKAYWRKIRATEMK